MPKPYRYRLEGKTPVVVEDLIEWAKHFENDNRLIAKTKIGNLNVSTVFLGIDHGFLFIEDERPILFETMIFGGIDDYQTRYCTYDEALIGHREAIRVARSVSRAGRVFNWVEAHWLPISIVGAAIFAAIISHLVGQI